MAFPEGAKVNAFVRYDFFEHSWWLVVQLLLWILKGWSGADIAPQSLLIHWQHTTPSRWRACPLWLLCNDPDFNCSFPWQPISYFNRKILELPVVFSPHQRFHGPSAVPDRVVSSLLSIVVSFLWTLLFHLLLVCSFQTKLSFPDWVWSEKNILSFRILYFH